MELRSILIYVFFISILVFSGATYDEILNDKRKQIEILNTQLEAIRDSSNKYNALFATIEHEADSLTTEIESINKFLIDFENEKYLTPLELAQETNIVLFLEEEIGNIQQNFQNKVVNLYKHGKNYELELLLSSKTPNEYLRRNQYLQRFSQNRKKELRELKTKKFILEEKKKLITLSVSSQRFYVETKRTQREEIQKSLDELENKKSLIRNIEEGNKQRILYTENQISAIRNYITNLQENKLTFSGSNSPSRINYPDDNFEQLKGMLNPPLDMIVIKNSFGNIADNQTGLVTFNTGIDFSIVKGSKVYSIAAGRVVLKGKIQNLGEVVIISHNNGYRSLYGNLESSDVKIGDEIRNNQVIGRTGIGKEGHGLHFEFWKDKTPLNPSEWLKMK